MALTPNLIPSQVATFPCPYDATLAFCSAQNIGGASGFVAGNVNATLDLGGAAPVAAAGRTDFIWTTDITSLNFGTADESYTLRLIGSNDVAFGNGNCELLAMHDFAATAALRNLTAVLGATPTIPPTNLGGTIIQMAVTNLMQRIYYRYLKLHMVVVGTGPAFTATSWISRANINF
jgi:hypothetical protein